MLISKKQKRPKIRHREYYDLTATFDKLFADSQKNKVFTSLMPIITSEENIKLAYRNMKKNRGSGTAGTDGYTISDVAKLSEQDFIRIIRQKLSFYKPKPVKRVEIPKPNGKTRPLGIPTIIDRIVQQCILQVLEPICEAKFYERSYGFRPNRSAEHAIASCQQAIQLQKLHFVVDIDIKGFFDNVNHAKLKKQMWTMGIRDKQLICIISEMLKAPIIMPDDSTVIPDRGTPQGGILSPLLSNIVLNELDWWVSSQWENFPTRRQYATAVNPNGSLCQGAKYTSLKKYTNLKEVFIVRYADDFKLFCRYYQDAVKMYAATKQWLATRLKLEISEEKSKIINLKRQYSDFLGFKMKVVQRGKGYVVRSHLSDKAYERERQKLIDQIKRVQHAPNTGDASIYLNFYNSSVIGIHNYFQFATCVNLDCHKMARSIDAKWKNAMGRKLKRQGDSGKGYIASKYGMSQQIRFLFDRPVVPVAYVKNKYPMAKKRKVCSYTAEGREEIYKPLGVNMNILFRLMRSTALNQSIEFMDNRVSLYAGQNGKCAVTGQVLEFEDIHCHHIVPKHLGGGDGYANLVIVHAHVHRLIHAETPETIQKYLVTIQLDDKMLAKLNKLRQRAALEPITK